MKGNLKLENLPPSERLLGALFGWISEPRPTRVRRTVESLLWKKWATAVTCGWSQRQIHAGKTSTRRPHETRQKYIFVTRTAKGFRSLATDSETCHLRNPIIAASKDAGRVIDSRKIGHREESRGSSVGPGGWGSVLGGQCGKLDRAGRPQRKRHAFIPSEVDCEHQERRHFPRRTR